MMYSGRSGAALFLSRPARSNILACSFGREVKHIGNFQKHGYFRRIPASLDNVRQIGGRCAHCLGDMISFSRMSPPSGPRPRRFSSINFPNSPAIMILLSNGRLATSLICVLIFQKEPCQEDRKSRCIFIQRDKKVLVQIDEGLWNMVNLVVR